MDTSRGIAARGHVDACLAGLKMYSLDPDVVLDVLLRPNAHWQRVVKEKRGKQRVCYSPSDDLRTLQWRLIRILDRSIKFHRGYCRIWDQRYAFTISKPRFPQTGWWKGSSIVANARVHRHSNSALVCDLRHAFQSITTRHIQSFLNRTQPFRIRRRRDASWTYFPESLMWVASRLLTYYGRLRYGAPASPIMFNFMIDRLAVDLATAVNAPLHVNEAALRSTQRILMTVYGDDICFSCKRGAVPESVLWRTETLVRQQGFRMNHAKTLRSGNGALLLPGVVISAHEVRPRDTYLDPLATAIQGGELTQDQANGHLGFLKPFKRPGRRALKRWGPTLYAQLQERAGVTINE